MEQNETILRYEVEKAIDTGKAFSMSFVNYSETRGTGGALTSVTNWAKVKSGGEYEEKSEKRIGTSPIYNPEHFKNGTINIYNPNNAKQHIIKVHLCLITIFNGKRVIN